MEKDKPTEYNPTQQEIEDFIIHKNGYSKKEERLGVGRNINDKTRGKLIHREGKREEVLYENKPWALLQSLKKGLIKQGYKSSNLIITYV
jgi:hypothetical protein